MAVEIERKFLVDKKKWERILKEQPKELQQGYLLTDPEKTIRVRVANEKGFITIKGKSIGPTRAEYEYEIPKIDASELLDNFCDAVISKLRYEIFHDEKIWAVDVFLGANEGLIIAEIELNEETETFSPPEFISEEVTGIEKYFNSSLSNNPFKNWKKNNE